MSDDNIREIIDALRDGIGLCITLEKSHTYEKKALSVEAGLAAAKYMLQDLLNSR